MRDCVKNAQSLNKNGRSENKDDSGKRIGFKE